MSNTTMRYFHDYVRAKRLERKLTLREFCRKAALDPSNWSRIERGVADPPKSIEMLSRLASVLEFSHEEFATLKDLALIESIPSGTETGRRRTGEIADSFYNGSRRKAYRGRVGPVVRNLGKEHLTQIGLQIQAHL